MPRVSGPCSKRKSEPTSDLTESLPEPRSSTSSRCSTTVVGCASTRSLDAISVGVFLRQSGVMSAALVERMAPEELWMLFQRVVPVAPVRAQGGGTVGAETARCWPRSSSWPPRAAHGPNSRRAPACQGSPPSGASPSGPKPGCGPSSTAWSWTNSARGESLTGRGVRSIQSASELSKGAADRTESDRPRQEGIENPPHRGSPGPAPVDRHLRRQPPRQPGSHPAGPRHPARSLSTRPAARGPASCMVTRATTTATCGDGSLPAASGTVSPVGASSHPDTWADTAG